MSSNRIIKLIKLLSVFIVAAGFLFLTGCVGLFPQFTYQGRLTDENGLPITGQVKIRYQIYDQDTGGTALYAESETVTVDNGNFNSVVGPSGIVGGLTPDDLTKPLWIELEIGNGTITETLTPRQRLYGAPYAFTLMPGTVISSSFDTNSFGALGIEGIVSVKNTHDGDASNMALPALMVQGDVGLELKGLDPATSDDGTIYSAIDDTNSDLAFFSNDAIFLQVDQNDTIANSYLEIQNGVGNEICKFEENGNLHCTGDLTADGAKPAVINIQGEDRYLYAIESPEVWFEDFGSAQLESGEAWISIETLFAETINLNKEYHVFLTPLGDCAGLYIAEKTPTGFLVKELGGGTSSIGFDYRITAKRLGYEDDRMEIMPVSGEE